MIRFLLGAGSFSFFYSLTDEFAGGEGRKHSKKQRKLSRFLAGIAGGAAFAGCQMLYGSGSLGIISPRGIVIFLYLGILLVVARIDHNTQWIYDRFHIMIGILACLDLLLDSGGGAADRLAGALVISVPMLLLAFVLPGAFGGGDIKLMAASGLLLGTASVVCAMAIGILTGGAYAAVMTAGKTLKKKDQFAFGPFLAIGLVAAVFWGDTIIQWYFGSP